MLQPTRQSASYKRVIKPMKTMDIPNIDLTVPFWLGCFVSATFLGNSAIMILPDELKKYDYADYWHLNEVIMANLFYLIIYNSD